MIRPEDVSDQMLMALADDELQGSDAQHLRALIAADDTLAGRYAAFAESRLLLQQAFPQDPVPDRLIKAVLNGPSRGPSTGATVLPFGFRSTQAAGWGMALAASVVLALGGYWLGRGMAPPTTIAGPEAAAIALAGTPTGGEVALPDGTTARALGSYATDLGLCRLVAQGQMRHLVCRGDALEDWRLALSIASGDAGTYLPASDMANEVIDRLLDQLGAGPALTPAQEEESLQP